jgi:hypothetical protein
VNERPTWTRRGEERPAAYLDGWRSDWTFATPEQTERRLLDAGPLTCGAGSRASTPPARPASYLSAIRLGSFLARLPDELSRPFVAAALERLLDRSRSSSCA